MHQKGINRRWLTNLGSTINTRKLSSNNNHKRATTEDLCSKERQWNNCFFFIHLTRCVVYVVWLYRSLPSHFFIQKNIMHIPIISVWPPPTQEMGFSQWQRRFSLVTYETNTYDSSCDILRLLFTSERRFDGTIRAGSNIVFFLFFCF